MGLASREGNPHANESPGWLKELPTKVLRDDYSSSADLPKSIPPSRGFYIPLSRPKGDLGLEWNSWKVCIPCELRDSWLNYAVSIVRSYGKSFGSLCPVKIKRYWVKLRGIDTLSLSSSSVCWSFFPSFFLSFRKEILTFRIAANIYQTVWDTGERFLD